MGPDALHSIQQTLRTPARHGTALVIFGVCSLLLLLVLTQVLVTQWRRRRRLAERWRRFTQGMVRRRLSAPQRALLAEMARRDAPEDPASLLQDLEAFEHAVHRHLKPLLAGGGGQHAVQSACGLLRELRAALGFGAARGREYFSTRELQRGQAVELYGMASADTPICHGTVGEPREDYLELVELKQSQPITGRTVRAAFYSMGRRFDFETQPLHVDLAHSVCRLAHTVDVRAADSREHFRVERLAPLSIRAQWEPADAWRQAQLRNISAGGAAIVAGFFYETGEQIVVQLSPAQYLPPAALEEEEDLGVRSIGAAVLETRKLPDERCLYRVEFRDVSPEDRRYLYRLVQKLQIHGEADEA